MMHETLMQLRAAKEKEAPREVLTDVLTKLGEDLRRIYERSLDYEIRKENEGSFERILDASEDILNQAMMRIYNNVHKFSGTNEGMARAWVGRIVKNLVCDRAAAPRRRNQKWRMLFARVSRNDRNLLEDFGD